MQKLNVESNMQQKVVPFSQVADMSIAEDAIKMVGKS
jgi:hypothetical protein